MAMTAARGEPVRGSGGLFNIGSGKAPEGAGGVAVAIVLVLLICALGLLIAQIATSAAMAAFPWAQPWLILVFAGLALIPLLLITARVFPWMTNWFYLLPALIALLAFTVFPIAMTVYFAFTNFSAENSGRPDSTTEIAVTRATETTLKLNVDAKLETLRCANPNCVGEAFELRPNGDTGRQGPAFTVVKAEGSTITFAGIVPEDATLVRRINPVQNIGFGNFQQIFAKAGVQLWPVFIWNLVFALGTTLLNTVAGLVLGILLNNKRLKFRNFYRSLLILPWAVPGVISIQMWVALLNLNFGGLNRLLGVFGGLPVPWLIDPLWAKMAILLVNLWLGFPYMMTATLGALSAIPDELYEAAEIDGANKLDQVRFITLPMLQAAFTPIVLSTFAFNFNNFSIIYLLTNGGPVEEGRLPTAQSTDILLSWGFKTAFSASGAQAYGIASAVALIVGVLTIGISIFNFRAAGVFKEARR
jgi:arabinogalactan oligomer / maltooligosaccharide transport system permease protein